MRGGIGEVATRAVRVRVRARQAAYLNVRLLLLGRLALLRKMAEQVRGGYNVAALHLEGALEDAVLAQLLGLDPV